MKVFHLNNPNADALVLDKEQGSNSDDTYFSSIGDATLKHIQTLNPSDRQLWEELIHMKNGAIFRAVPSWDQFDKDPFNLKGKDLEKYLEKFKHNVPQNKLDAVKEAFEVEQTRRTESEDALDRAETVSFDDWQNHPGLWSAIDLPSTPKDRFIYMGNTTQAFYDEFPEGHPDEVLIQKILTACDRNWNSVEDDNYITWLEQLIAQSKGLQSTKTFLTQMVNALNSTSEPESIIADYLNKIDTHWSQYYRKAALKSLERNSLFQLLNQKTAEWTVKFKEQHRSVLPEIRRFGSIVYTDKTLKAQATSVFWSKYRQICEEFAPQVIFNGLDINRANLTDLSRIFNISRNEAINIWYKRPFASIDELYFKNLISKTSFTNNNEQVEKVLKNIEDKTQQSILKKNIMPLSQLANALNTLKANNRLALTDKEWQFIWTFYNIQRNHFKVTMNDKQKGEENV